MTDTLQPTLDPSHELPSGELPDGAADAAKRMIEGTVEKPEPQIGTEQDFQSFVRKGTAVDVRDPRSKTEQEFRDNATKEAAVDQYPVPDKDLDDEGKSSQAVHEAFEASDDDGRQSAILEEAEKQGLK